MLAERWSMTGMQARFHHDVNCLFSLRPRQDMRHCLLCPTQTGGCSWAKTGTHSGVVQAGLHFFQTGWAAFGEVNMWSGS